MDFLRTPGANLIGLEKIQFDEIKGHIENGTNEMLLRPDWDINIRIVDLVNTCSSQNTVNEVMFLIRKRLLSGQPKTVYLALTITEALVKNCGHRVYTAVNQESFMKDMGKVARKYSAKTGTDYAEVATLALDVIQAWGEAFLPLQHRYPNITRLYQDLRKERLPFSNQYDKARVPIFTESELMDSSSIRRPSQSSNTSSYNQYGSSSSSGGNGGGGNTFNSTTDDEIMAQALAASLAEFPGNNPSLPLAMATSSGTTMMAGTSGNVEPRSRRESSSSSSSSQPLATPFKPNSVKNDTLESIQTSTSILRDMIIAASTSREIVTNDIAVEIYNQLTFLLSRLAGVIENELVTNPEGLAALFTANDEAQSCSSVFDKLKRGTYTLEQGKKILVESQANSKANAAINPTSETTSNLLDFDSNPTIPAPSFTTPSKSDPFSTSKQTSISSKVSPLEETMGLFSITQNSSSKQNKPTPTLPMPTRQESNRRPSSEFSPPPKVVSTSSRSNTIVEDDPFGPSSSSSIDALLVDPSITTATKSSSSSSSSSFSSVPVVAVPVTSYDPFAIPVTSTPASNKPLTGATVDPLDGLLAIATRSDDFGQLSSPPPPPPSVSIMNNFPPSTVPLQPTRYESNTPPMSYQGIPASTMPGQAPYPGIYGNTPVYPGPGGSLSQPHPWPTQPMIPNQPGAPPAYWQVGGPQVGGPPLQGPPPVPGSQSQNNKNANPFDLF